MPCIHPARSDRRAALRPGCLLALVGAALLTGCPHASPLPGWPIAAPGGAAGPVHLQRLEAAEGDRVTVMERLEADGRPPTLRRLILDREGRIRAETPLPADTPLPGVRWTPLPQATPRGDVLGVEYRHGGTEISLRGGDPRLAPLVLLRLPGGRGVHIPGVHLAPDDLAVVGFESRHGAIRVEGLRVLDLRRGRAMRRLAAADRARADGRWAVAEAWLLEAERLDPGVPDVAYALAAVKARTGDPQAALRWLEQALAGAPRRLRARIARDPAFDALRDRADFRALVGPGAQLPAPPRRWPGS